MPHHLVCVSERERGHETGDRRGERVEQVEERGAAAACSERAERGRLRRRRRLVLRPAGGGEAGGDRVDDVSAAAAALGRCRDAGGDAVRYAEMGGDGGRCGEMWGDVGRCGEVWGPAEMPAEMRACRKVPGKVQERSRKGLRRCRRRCAPPGPCAPLCRSGSTPPRSARERPRLGRAVEGWRLSSLRQRGASLALQHDDKGRRAARLVSCESVCLCVAPACRHLLSRVLPYRAGAESDPLAALHLPN